MKQKYEIWFTGVQIKKTKLENYFFNIVMKYSSIKYFYMYSFKLEEN